MTEQEKQGLSQAIADKYGIEAYRERLIDEATRRSVWKTWLHEDWARLMPLAVEQSLFIVYGIDYVNVRKFQKNSIEFYNNHPTKEEAVRIAICRALIEKE